MSWKRMSAVDKDTTTPILLEFAAATIRNTVRQFRYEELGRLFVDEQPRPSASPEAFARLGRMHNRTSPRPTVSSRVVA